MHHVIASPARPAVATIAVVERVTHQSTTGPFPTAPGLSTLTRLGFTSCPAAAAAAAVDAFLELGPGSASSATSSALRFLLDMLQAAATPTADLGLLTAPAVR